METINEEDRERRRKLIVRGHVHKRKSSSTEHHEDKEGLIEH